MAFTSYISATDATEYLGVFHGGASVDDASLVRASYTLDRIYRDRFIGAKTDAAQEHEWPRNGDTTVPNAIKHATIELAIAEFDPYAVEPGVLSKSVSIGDISESTTFAPSSVRQQTPLTQINKILGGYITADTAEGGIAFARLVKSY